MCLLHTTKDANLLPDARRPIFRLDTMSKSSQRRHENPSPPTPDALVPTPYFQVRFIATQFLFLGGNGLSGIDYRKLIFPSFPSFPTFPTFPTVCQTQRIENFQRKYQKT